MSGKWGNLLSQNIARHIRIFPEHAFLPWLWRGMLDRKQQVVPQ
jgi:hypothetical protein